MPGSAGLLARLVADWVLGRLAGLKVDATTVLAKEG